MNASVQGPQWPVVGETAWIVFHQHTWDAHNNNTYYPVPRKVSGIDGSTVHFKGGEDRPIAECFVSQEECKRACPAPHPDE